MAVDAETRSAPTQNGVTTSPAPSRSNAWFRSRTFLVPVAALVTLIAFFGLRNPDFISINSADNILRQMSFLTVLALAGTLVILIGGIDLSVAANATLSGILVASLIDKIPSPAAILLVLVIGGAIGIVNGLVTIYLRVPSFLVTLGMLSILNGISNTISKGGPVSFQSTILQKLINDSAIPGLPNGSLIALLLVAGLTVLCFLTAYGRHLFAVGSNERAARLAGIRVNRLKLSVFGLAGVTAALAGIIFTGQASTGTPLGADPSLLNSIAAIVVGGTALSGGIGGPHRTLLGALIIVILSSGMDISSVGPYTQDVVQGLVLIAAVALTIDRRRYGVIR